MKNAKRRIAGLMLVLAAVTGLVLPCLCAGMAAAPATSAHAHDCCVPADGLRAAPDRCCPEGHGAPADPTWTATAALILAAPFTSFVLPAATADVVATVAAPPQRPVAASPPLRI